MIHYRKILELHHNKISLGEITVCTGSSRPKVITANRLNQLCHLLDAPVTRK
ncbi:hypothetical protein [Oceanobacillus damuensis]|uniref:hypothetical protein n=1 Tax=Oceanobacillus damuensis TaxID=937928 RepID=UPI0018FF0549|nr:hypothetical protein [Oceanobacillus damuensis]